MKKFFIIFLTAVFSILNAEDTVKAVLFPFREAVISSRVESTLQPYRFRIGELFKKDATFAEHDGTDDGASNQNSTTRIGTDLTDGQTFAFGFDGFVGGGFDSGFVCIFHD